MSEETVLGWSRLLKGEQYKEMRVEIDMVWDPDEEVVLTVWAEVQFQ